MRQQRYVRMHLGGIGFALAISLMFVGSARAVVLPPGFCVATPGTTSAARPELAGVVIHDELINFEIKNAAGALLYKGILQNRVVRSNLTGTLIFMYRIRDTQPALNGYVETVRTIRFPLFMTDVDFRVDGSGTIGPGEACRGAGVGVVIDFDFSGRPIFSGEESKFFFIMTDATAFAPGGDTTLVLITGEAVTLPTVMPISCDSIKKFKNKCKKGSLKSTITSSLPAGTVLTIDNDGDRKEVVLDGGGSGTAKWVGQNGPRQMTILECPTRTCEVSCPGSDSCSG